MWSLIKTTVCGYHIALHDNNGSYTVKEISLIDDTPDVLHSFESLQEAYKVYEQRVQYRLFED